MNDGLGYNIVNGSGGGGPCGACKFLRRKCVKGCVFAPYFDAEQGAAHFAAVHKVFGASNASKLLMRVPVHKRVDAVVTLCYEAIARVRDPVYGCVGQIFTLQQQVVNLQAELACIQARLSTLQRLPLMLAPVQSCSSPNLRPSSELQVCNSNNMTLHFDPLKSEQTSMEMASFCSSVNEELEDAADFHSIGQDFVSRYCPAGVEFKPPTSH